MKYKPEYYAKALAAVIHGSPSKEKEAHIEKNILDILRKNGDIRHLKKILELTERELRIKTGRRKITIETARPLGNMEKRIASEIGHPHDVFETKITPELVAGMRITINDELQFDRTLKRKLEKIFS